ncbi:hypothetical protein Tco_0294800 [Tanacetum coccineum]
MGLDLSYWFGFRTHHACSIAFVVRLLIAKRGGRGKTSGGTTESGASRGDANNGRRKDERSVVSRGQSSALQLMDDDDIRQILDHEYLQNLSNEDELLKEECRSGNTP